VDYRKISFDCDWPTNISTNMEIVSTFCNYCDVYKYSWDVAVGRPAALPAGFVCLYICLSVYLSVRVSLAVNQKYSCVHFK